MKVTFFIDRPVFSAVISIVIVIVGIIGLTMLPVDQYPQITPPVVKISASYPGASALTVSQAVATPIEQEINGTPGMLYMESNSSNSGGFSATVTFDVSADPDLAAVEIQNRVKLAESRLPAEVIQNGISVEKQAPSQLMTLCLTSTDPKFDEIYLSNFATINVLDVIRRIPGVGRVSNIGSRYYAMQIWAQPDKLANFGLTVQDLQNALKDQNRESVKKKFALSRQGAVDLIKGCIACMLQNLSLMLPVGLLYWLVSNLLNQTVIDTGKVIFYSVGCAVAIALIVLTTWFQYNATYFATYTESGKRRISLAEQLRKIPLSFFGKKDLADLTSTIMADCTFLEQSFSHFIPELVGSMISTVLIAIGLFVYDWRMACAALWVLPVSFAIVFFSAKVQEKLNNRQMEAKMACADGIQECIETVRDLKANNAEEAYLKGLDKKIKAVEKRAIISELGTAVFVVSATLILKLGIVTVALVGAMLLMNGTLDVLTFFLFLLVVARLYDPLQTVLQNLAAVISTRTNIRRMKEILDHPIQTGSDTLTNQGYDIVFDHVGFSYNTGERVLEDVSFTAKQGEVTALVGPSGSGKTTVSRLASRFWDIQQGKITVGGMDISQIEPETLLSLYSIVFQDVTLFNNSIMENIRVGRKDATDEEVLAAAKLANCEEFARKLPEGWNTIIGENGCSLSGGERQRISIARAFLKNAPIILLDEATASLDVENETVIQTALSRLIQNKTVLVIAHRMRTVASADKIVVLEKGKVAQEGNSAELMNSNGIYHHMVTLQTESQNWTLE